MSTKKLADQVFKGWFITSREGDMLTDSFMYNSLQEAKTVYEDMIDCGEFTLEDEWYIQEVTLGAKYTLEQEPKWKEIK